MFDLDELARADEALARMIEAEASDVSDEDASR